jgi:hypothetical protein
MLYIKTSLLVIRCVFCYLFKIKDSKNNDYYLAGKCLLSLSFRYPGKDKNSLIFFVKYFIRTLLLKKIYLPDTNKRYSEGNEFFYDISYDSEKQRILYLEYFLKKPINGGIWKEKSLGYFTFLGKLIQLFSLLILFSFLFPIALFSSISPASLALIFTEYIETVNLLYITRKNKVSILYYFCIYEKNSNITTIALQSDGAKVIKIPSEVPFFFWNKIIIADTLVLCDTNQLEELERYKDTIHIQETVFWGPERCVEVLNRYKLKSIREAASNQTIGLYSSAAYIRKMEGQLLYGNMLAQEDALKSILAEYLIINKSAKLLIFPHPKEKNNKYEKIVINHYSKYFEGLNYSVVLNPKPSSYYLEMVELGISLYSTIIYERLFFGFKCLLFSSPHENFPLAGTPLSNISSEDKNSLFNKIDLFLSFKTDEYFSFTGIKKSPFFENI